jgi:hypothetical protein
METINPKPLVLTAKQFIINYMASFNRSHFPNDLGPLSP